MDTTDGVLAQPSNVPTHAWSDFAAVCRLHIVAIGSLGCLTFGWIFSGHYLGLAALTAALDWFLVNFLNRTVDVDEDEINGIAGSAFVRARRRGLTALGLVTLIASLPLTAWLVPELLLPRLAFHLLGVSYNWSLIPGTRRLKEVYFVKNLASAMGFQLTVIAYPLAVMNSLSLVRAVGISTVTVIFASIFLLFFVLSYEVLYDLRDLAGDRRIGAKTYPVVHGEKAAKRLVDLFCLIAIATLAVGYIVNVVPWRLFVMIIAPLTQLILYKRQVARGETTSRFCTGLTWFGAALLALYNLWVLCALPGVS